MCSRNYRQQLQRWLQVFLCSIYIFFNNTGLLVFKLNISVASSVFNSTLEETFRDMAAFKISPSIGVSRSRCREAAGQNSLPHRTPFGQHRRARRGTTQTNPPPVHGTARPRRGQCGSREGQRGQGPAGEARGGRTAPGPGPGPAPPPHCRQPARLSPGKGQRGSDSRPGMPVGYREMRHGAASRSAF